MNKRNNKNLLNEEVNKFKTLLEYAFYEDRDIEEDGVIADELLLGTVSEEEKEIGSEEEEEVEGGEEEVEGGEEDGLDIPDEDINIPGEEEGDEELDDSGDDEGFGGEDAEFGGDDAGEDLEMAPEEDPMDDAVELDVTELVKGSEEAKASADSANQKIDQLMGMIDNLENQVSSMSQISTKIDSLENELEKRAPTPNEKLEMISMDSAPFNMRLGDFWKDQEGQYDVMSDDKKDKEYVLDKKEIQSDYSDDKLKDSFSDDNEYEEEDF